MTDNLGLGTKSPSACNIRVLVDLEVWPETPILPKPSFS